MSFNRVKFFHDRAFDHISEALKLDEASKGKPHNESSKIVAMGLYRKGIADMESGISCSVSEQSDDYGRCERLKEKMKKNMNECVDRVTELEAMISNPTSGGKRGSLPKESDNSKYHPKNIHLDRPGNGDMVVGGRRKPKPRSVSPKPTASSSAPNRSRVPATTRPKATNQHAHVADKVKGVKGVDSKLANMILDQIIETGCSTSFDDVAGLDNAKAALQETVILPSIKPELFTGLRSPVQGILLFGPPGNGKTLLAKAVASEANCTFFNISASALTSKWVGEAEKLVKSMFVLARELQPAIIFIDEVDSILSERKESENDASRRLKTEFLLQFDGVGSSSSDRILIMGATNRPFDLDAAVLRRFPKRILIPLPEVDTRYAILDKLLTSHGRPLTSRQLQSIARATDNYSGWDLTSLAKDAAMGPIREIEPGKLKNMDAKNIRPINMQDFESALQRIRASTDPSILDALYKFNAQFGDCS